MPTATRTFRVFVSSTFEDLREARNALAAPGGPFSELTKLCLSFGARFQAIDLRWGVREEAGLDQRTMEICLGEIERCQRTGIKPNFIVLLGNRYGWRPLAARIEAEEFRVVRDHITEMEDRARVDDWYRLDENAVPAEYLLNPRTDEFVDMDRWADMEAAMHKALREAARAANLPADALIKYEASATHQEILKGIGKTAEDREHVFAFFTKPSEPSEDPDLTNLKQFLRDELKGNVFEPRTASELCDRVRENLDRVIQAEAAAFKSRTALDLEAEAHDAFARDRARHFMGRKDVLGAIDEYVNGRDRRPMVVSGASGSGKSAVIARASESLLDGLIDAVVIRRFTGVTPESSSGTTLLRSLCEQIGQRYGVREEIPVEFDAVVRAFVDRLGRATSEQPLVLFIDGLDQVGADDPAAAPTWLMPELPPHCRVVVSTTYVAPSLARARMFELEPLPPTDAHAVFERWLFDAGRDLQAWQCEKVLDYYSRCSLPLYLKLAFEESRLWKSFAGPEQCLLGDGLDGIIDLFFDRISGDSNHGALLVSRSLGYLAAARYGLTEDEILDVLTQDFAVWNDFLARAHYSPPERQIPVIVWSRLSLDLDPYLAQRSVHGGLVTVFYHRQIGRRAAERFLRGSNRRARHRRLAAYFKRQADPGRDHTWQSQNNRALVELPFQCALSGLMGLLRALLGDLLYLARRIEVRDVYSLINDYPAELVAGSTELHYFKSFLTRHLHSLIEFPGALLSLVSHEGNSLSQSQLVAVRSGGTWPHPWLDTKVLSKRARKTEPLKPDSEALNLHSYTEFKSMSVGFASGPRVAFYLERLGRLRALDLETGVESPYTLEIRPDRPVLILPSPSGQHLCVAHDDGRAEVYCLSWSQEGIPTAAHPTAQFDFLLPEQEAPAIAWHQDTIVFQSPVGHLVDLRSGSDGWYLSTILNESFGELSGLAFSIQSIFASFERGGDTELVAIRETVVNAQTLYPSKSVTALTLIDETTLAVAFSDQTIVVLDCATGFRHRAQLSADSLPLCICADAGSLLWAGPSNGINRWTYRSDGESYRIADRGQVFLPDRCIRVRLIVKGSGGHFDVLADNRAFSFSIQTTTSLQSRDLRMVQLSKAGHLILIEKRDSALVLVDTDQDRELSLGSEEGGRLFFAIDGANRLLAACATGGARLYDLNNVSRASFVDTPLGINSLAGDEAGGFWLTDRDGYIFFADHQGSRQVASPGTTHVAGSTVHRLGSEMVWAGRLPENGDLKDVLLFYTVGMHIQGRLRRLGQRTFPVEYGVIEALSGSIDGSQLSIVFGNHHRHRHLLIQGSVQDLLAETEKEYPLTDVGCTIVALLPSPSRGLSILTADGNLLWADSSFKIRCGCPPSTPFMAQSWNLITRGDVNMVADLQGDVWQYQVHLRPEGTSL